MAISYKEVEGQTRGIGEQARTTGITLPKSPHIPRPIKPPSSYKLRSKVWIDFYKLRDENGAEWAICKHCKKRYRGESTRGTANLLKHLRNCQKKREAEQRTPKDQPVPFMVIEADSLEHFELIDNIFSPSLDETIDRLMSSSRKQQGNSEHQMPRHQAGPFKVIKSTSPEDLKLINYIFYSSLDERLDFLPSSKLLYVFFFKKKKINFLYCEPCLLSVRLLFIATIII